MKNNQKFKRVFLIVMDSVGVGHAKDAEAFGDYTNPNTFFNIDKGVNGLKTPNLEKLGWGTLDNYIGLKPITNPNSFVTRLYETSLGKDTMTGHWEIMGLEITKPFQTFTDTGFPKELLDELSEKSGHGIIGNCAASGTEILKTLGEQHMKTGDLIVYTSADSVLQIAAHEDVIPVPELYKICAMAREITMKDEWKVGRIIARPFIGTCADDFKRTPRRHDYALSPVGKTYLEYLKENGHSVISVGKINDIFNTVGITDAYKTTSNEDGMNITINIGKKDFEGLCFVNLVDFDMLFGHRRDVNGYAKSIEDFDIQLGQLINILKDDDLVILTADHGNDPTAPGSDHTRETIPGIFFSKSLQKGKNLGTFDSFGVLGATIADNFGISDTKNLLGPSILAKLK